MIAAAHHISLRSLHQLFHDEGLTVAGWIRQRRLECCRRDLSDPALAARPVAAIAARWGFLEPGRLQPGVPRRARAAPGGVPHVCAHCEGPCALAQRQRRSRPADACRTADLTYGKQTGGSAMSTTETERPQAATRWGTRRRNTSGCGRRPACGRPPTGRLLDQVGLRAGRQLPGRRLRAGRDDAR